MRFRPVFALMLAAAFLLTGQSAWSQRTGGGGGRPASGPTTIPHSGGGFGGHGFAMGRGGFGGHGFVTGHSGFAGRGFAINRGGFEHGRFEGRRFGRGFYAYGGNYGLDSEYGYCDPYYYPYGCYGY